MKTQQKRLEKLESVAFKFQVLQSFADDLHFFGDLIHNFDQHLQADLDQQTRSDYFRLRQLCRKERQLAGHSFDELRQSIAKKVGH